MKKVLSLFLAFAAVFLLMPISALGLSGTADYTPAESNISEKFWVNFTADSRSDDAGLVADGNPETLWVTDASSAWIMADLGGTYDAVRKVEILFASNKAAYQYKLEGSTDTETWVVLADRTGNTTVAGGFTDIFAFEGLRYVKLTITGGLPVGVREFRIINYLRADLDNGADMSEQGGNTSAFYYNANNNPPEPGFRGGRFSDEGSIENGNNIFGLTKDMGWDTIRLRIWNEPSGENNGVPNTGAGNCSPANTRRVAKAVVGAGQNLAIDLHYSDSWADPGNQPKPLSWAKLPFDELVETVYEWTYDTIESFVDQGTTPEVVALGNEIMRGMLWGTEYFLCHPNPDRHYYVTSGLWDNTPGGGVEWLNWNDQYKDLGDGKFNSFLASIERFATLLDAGNRAIRDLNKDKGTHIATELHFANSVFEGSSVIDPDWAFKRFDFITDKVFESMSDKGGFVDRIGISYYPTYHGWYDVMQNYFYLLTQKFPGVRLHIAETSPSASGTNSNWYTNSNRPIGFVNTNQSQGDQIVEMMQLTNDLPNNVGMGVWPWAPTGVFFTGGQPRASMKAWSQSFAKNVVESGVYVTTAAGVAPALPATVKSLDLASGAITNVAVVWNAVDPSLYAADGTFTVNGVAQVTVPDEGKGREMNAVTATVTVSSVNYPYELFTTPPAIVEGFAANIKIFVPGAPDGTVVSLGNSSVPLANGSGVLKLPSAPAAGKAILTAKNGDDTITVGEIAVIPYDTNIWKPTFVGTSTITGVRFPARIEADEARFGVLYDGELPVQTTVGDMYFYVDPLNNMVTLPRTPAVGETITISGIKYPDLFPSYSFTFTITR